MRNKYQRIGVGLLACGLIAFGLSACDNAGSTVSQENESAGNSVSNCNSQAGGKLNPPDSGRPAVSTQPAAAPQAVVRTPVKPGAVNSPIPV